MFYSASLTPVYNYYKTGYASTSTSRYDTHKRSELQNIYHSIVNLNKESPLYILDTSRASREFAVGLKENARQLRNTIASLGGLNETEMFSAPLLSAKFLKTAMFLPLILKCFPWPPIR